MGAWAALRCAARGASVGLVEQFSRGHCFGSSHGDGRIWRKAYDEDLYVDMMELSLKLWPEDVMKKTGLLCFEDKGKDVLKSLVSLFERRGLAHQEMEPGQVRSRFPDQFGGTPEDVRAVYLDEAGVLYADRAMMETWRRAEELGVETFENCPVLRVEDNTVVCEKGAFYGKKIILAPGAWLTKVAEEICGIEISTKITAECVSYHAPENDKYDVEHMPVFMMRVDNGLGPHGYYGLPRIEVPGVKISAHHCGTVVDHGRVQMPTEAKDETICASHARLVERFWPGGRLDPQPLRTQRCLYTTTPDHDYVLGDVGNDIILAGGGSGHAFKMGPAIGDALACLALREEPPFDISQFSPRRPALHIRGGGGGGNNCNYDANAMSTSPKCK